MGKTSCIFEVDQTLGMLWYLPKINHWRFKQMYGNMTFHLGTPDTCIYHMAGAFQHSSKWSKKGGHYGAPFYLKLSCCTVFTEMFQVCQNKSV